MARHLDEQVAAFRRRLRNSAASVLLLLAFLFAPLAEVTAIAMAGAQALEQERASRGPRCPGSPHHIGHVLKRTVDGGPRAEEPYAKAGGRATPRLPVAAMTTGRPSAWCGNAKPSAR